MKIWQVTLVKLITFFVITGNLASANDQPWSHVFLNGSDGVSITFDYQYDISENLNNDCHKVVKATEVWINIHANHLDSRDNVEFSMINLLGKDGLVEGGVTINAKFMEPGHFAIKLPRPIPIESVCLNRVTNQAYNQRWTQGISLKINGLAVPNLNGENGAYSTWKIRL